MEWIKPSTSDKSGWHRARKKIAPLKYVKTWVPFPNIFESRAQNKKGTKMLSLKSKYRTHTCGELNKSNVGETVTLSGWVHRKRDHGALLFVDLRDNYGITQCVFDGGNAEMERVRPESVIKITGRVVARGYNSGHGNYIKLRHNASFETLYAHMSKFAKGVVVGTTVKQGQTIGYVGSTGLSTGPHLHYEIIKDGKHVNPMTVKLPAISNLGKEDKENFIEYRKNLDAGIERLSEHPDWFIQL